MDLNREKDDDNDDDYADYDDEMRQLAAKLNASVEEAKKPKAEAK